MPVPTSCTAMCEIGVSLFKRLGLLAESVRIGSNANRQNCCYPNGGPTHQTTAQYPPAVRFSMTEQIAQYCETRADYARQQNSAPPGEVDRQQHDRRIENG